MLKPNPKTAINRPVEMSVPARLPCPSEMPVATIKIPANMAKSRNRHLIVCIANPPLTKTNPLIPVLFYTKDVRDSILEYQVLSINFSKY